ncbi:hypothetical protein LCGC14_2989300, partial [marine sediment metagenome]
MSGNAPQTAPYVRGACPPNGDHAAPVLVGGGCERSASSAQAWLVRAAGGTDPASLVRAVERRYGKDRTFSVPILSMCALAGELGPAEQAWKWVRPLPFELALCPRGWLKALRLRVVSYALPALIALGQL